MKLLEKAIYKLFKCWPTYSQCGEDRIMHHLLWCLNKHHVTYLDIGTNHPKAANNTYLFYLHGGSGVCIEPNPMLCKKIKKQRSKDVCLNVGIGIENSEKLDFYIIDPDTLSTFSKEDAYELQSSGKYRIRQTLKIPVINFNKLLSDNFSTPPDIVSIDVEDLNEEIVKTINFEMRPLIFCVETLIFDHKNSNKKISSIKEHFLNNNYAVYADTFINTIFVDKNVFDFTWTKRD